jgi:hypothetical protein
VLGEGGNFEVNSYAGTISFEYRQTSNPSVNSLGSEEGNWSSLGLISLDKCIGFTRDIGLGQLATWLASNQATLNTWADGVLAQSGLDRDKAYVIDELNRRAIRFLDSSGIWQDEGDVLNPALDAIHDAENTTHYSDIMGDFPAFEQFRFVVRSVMNTINPTNDNPRVQMPEIQFFELPTNTINKLSVPTVDFLKAEDSTGTLHDILGRHQRLPKQSLTNWRLYIRTTHQVNEPLFLSFVFLNGSKSTISSTIVNDTAMNFTDISSSFRFFEVYRVVNGEEIILSSGYTEG